MGGEHDRGLLMVILRTPECIGVIVHRDDGHLVPLEPCVLHEGRDLLLGGNSYQDTPLGLEVCLPPYIQEAGDGQGLAHTRVQR